MKRWLMLVAFIAGWVMAEPTSPESEARRRFELASRLYAQGNKAQALEELERVVVLAERPAVLLNLVIVHAELGHPEAAVSVADKLLSQKTSFDEKRLGQVRTIRQQQRAKLGELRVSAPVEGVELTLAGRAIGLSPLSGPVLASAGTVVLSAKAPRYEPLYREVVVTAGTALEVVLELKPTTVNAAAVRVRCPVPGADLFVDGIRVGTTPDVVKFAVMPGSRTVSVRRDGYRSAEKTVTLPEGGEVELELAPTPDESAPVAEVKVTTSEDQVTVVADGQRQGLLLPTGLRLPTGPHLLTFERGGFYPVRRAVSLSPSTVESLDLVFEPTPELRAELASASSTHRLLGWIGVGVGAAGLAASAAYTFGYLPGERARANREIDEFNRQVDTRTGCYAMDPSCQKLIDIRNDQLRQADTLAAVGVTGLIVSAAVLGGGIVSLVTTPDLTKYDRPPANDDFVRDLAVAPLPGGGAVVTLAGGF